MVWPNIRNSPLEKTQDLRRTSSNHLSHGIHLTLLILSPSLSGQASIMVLDRVVRWDLHIRSSWVNFRGQTRMGVDDIDVVTGTELSGLECLKDCIVTCHGGSFPSFMRCSLLLTIKLFSWDSQNWRRKGDNISTSQVGVRLTHLSVSNGQVFVELILTPHLLTCVCISMARS